MINIYCLYEQGTTEIKYVGKTNDKLKYRLKRHIDESMSGKYSEKCNWLRLVHKRVKIRLLARVEDSKWEETEKYFIAKCRDKGHKLFNVLPGGESSPCGADNYFATHIFSGEKNGLFGKKHTESAKKKMSEVAKLNVGPRNGRYGKTHSLEVRERIASKLRGLKQSDETRLKKSIACSGEKNGFYGKNHTEETKRLIALKQGRKVVQLDKETHALINTFDTLTDAERLFPGNIGDNCRGKQKSACGFKWMFEEEYLKLHKDEQE